MQWVILARKYTNQVLGERLYCCNYGHDNSRTSAIACDCTRAGFASFAYTFKCSCNLVSTSALNFSKQLLDPPADRHPDALRRRVCVTRCICTLEILTAHTHCVKESRTKLCGHGNRLAWAASACKQTARLKLVPRDLRRHRCDDASRVTQPYNVQVIET